MGDHQRIPSVVCFLFFFFCFLPTAAVENQGLLLTIYFVVHLDPQLRDSITEVLRREKDRLSNQDHDRLEREAYLNYNSGTYITMQEEGKDEDAISVFTAMHPNRRFAREVRAQIQIANKLRKRMANCCFNHSYTTARSISSQTLLVPNTFT